MARAELDRRIAGRLARHCGEPATWVYDYRTQVSTWTPRIFQILGLPLDAAPLACDYLVSRYSPESRERLMAALVVANASGGTFCIDMEILPASGPYIAVRLAGRVTLAQGQPAYSTGTMALLRERMAARGGGLGS